MTIQSTTPPSTTIALCLLTTLLASVTSVAGADSIPAFQLSLKNQKFQPHSITVPAGQRIKLIVKNQDSLPMEIESNDFTLEQVIPGHSRNSVYIGPLEADTYGFFNDFHQTSQGELIAK